MHRRRIRVLFLLQRPEAWPNLESIWVAMHSNPGFKPSVLALPYNIEDPRTSVSKAAVTRAVLEAKGVPFEEWRDDWLQRNQPYDAVIINHPYDRERPRELWFDKLSASIPLTVYISYGLPMGGGKKNLRLQFAQPTQIGASVIVARSRWEREMYARHCPTGDAHVHILGHPRFDALLRDLSEQVPADMTEIIGGRLAILWNSHFSFAPAYSQSANFSTFDLIGPELFQHAKENRDWLCLIWRPHPGLFPVILREGWLSASEVASLRTELTTVGIILDERSSHAAAFKASDALLTDVGSFLLEYLVTGKPILALINPEGEPLNDESEALVAQYPKASDANEAVAFIEELATDSGKHPDLEPTRVEHLPSLDGCAGERIARLIEQLAQDTHRHPEIVSTKNGSFPLCGRVHNTPNGNTRPIQGTELPVTPVLDVLIRRLRQLRKQKAREAAWRKKLRRAKNSIRTSLGEATKHSAAIMHMAETLRMTTKRRS